MFDREREWKTFWTSDSVFIHNLTHHNWIYRYNCVHIKAKLLFSLDYRLNGKFSAHSIAKRERGRKASDERLGEKPCQTRVNYHQVDEWVALIVVRCESQSDDCCCSFPHTPRPDDEEISCWFQSSTHSRKKDCGESEKGGRELKWKVNRDNCTMFNTHGVDTDFPLSSCLRALLVVDEEESKVDSLQLSARMSAHFQLTSEFIISNNNILFQVSTHLTQVIQISFVSDEICNGSVLELANFA